MKKTICAACLLAFAVSSEHAWARGIYVDANAKINGTGTNAAPYQTIAQAMEQAREIRKNDNSRIVIHAFHRRHLPNPARLNTCAILHCRTGMTMTDLRARCPPHGR